MVLPSLGLWEVGSPPIAVGNGVRAACAAGGPMTAGKLRPKNNGEQKKKASVSMDVRR